MEPEHPLLPRHFLDRALAPARACDDAAAPAPCWSRFDLSSDVYSLFAAWTIFFAAGEKLAGYASAKRVIYDAATVYPYATLYGVISDYVMPMVRRWQTWFSSVIASPQHLPGDPAATLVYMHRPTPADMTALAADTTVPPVFISARRWPQLWAQCCVSGRRITPQDFAVGVCWYPKCAPPCLTFFLPPADNNNMTQPAPATDVTLTVVEISSALLFPVGTRASAYVEYCLVRATKAVRARASPEPSVCFNDILSADMTFDEAVEAMTAAFGEERGSDIMRQLGNLIVKAAWHETEAARASVRKNVALMRQSPSRLTFRFCPVVPWDAVFKHYAPDLEHAPLAHCLDSIEPDVLLAAVRLPDAF